MRGLFVISGYVVLAITGVVLWFVTRKPGGKLAPMAEMIERIMHKRTTRIAFVCAWWWLGWHFMANEVR